MFRAPSLATIDTMSPAQLAASATKAKRELDRATSPQLRWKAQAWLACVQSAQRTRTA